MRALRSLILFLLVAVAMTASAQESPNIQYRKVVFRNGLTLIVVENHRTPVVDVTVWVRVGSSYERVGHTALAHLAEHLAWGPSPNDPDAMGYIPRALTLGPSALNGPTKWDVTTFFQTVGVDALDAALWMESDRRGLGSALTEQLVERQKQVVTNEMLQWLNRPYGEADELIAENTYPFGHPYAHPVGGYVSDVARASLDDVRTWFVDHYGAANTILVVSGDVPDDIAKRVEHYFDDMPPGPPVVRRGPWVAKLTEQRRLAVEDKYAKLPGSR